MVTPDEQQAFQIANLEEAARQSESMSSWAAEAAGDQRQLATQAAAAAARGEASAAELAETAGIAKNNIERLKSGEPVSAGMNEPQDLETLLLSAGFSREELKHARNLAEISEIGGEAAFEEFMRAWLEERDHHETTFAKTFVRRLRK